MQCLLFTIKRQDEMEDGITALLRERRERKVVKIVEVVEKKIRLETKAADEQGRGRGRERKHVRERGCKEGKRIERVRE